MKINISREIIFAAIGFLIFISAALFSVYSIKFLFVNASAALDVESVDDRPIKRINFEGLKDIGIVMDNDVPSSR